MHGGGGARALLELVETGAACSAVPYESRNGLEIEGVLSNGTARQYKTRGVPRDVHAVGSRAVGGVPSGDSTHPSSLLFAM